MTRNPPVSMDPSSEVVVSPDSLVSCSGTQKDTVSANSEPLVFVYRRCVFHNQIRCGIRDSRVLDPFAKYSLAAREESVLWLFGLFYTPCAFRRSGGSSRHGLVVG